MSLFPSDPKKLKARIKSYESKLKTDPTDGYGKRYLLGSMYLMSGGLEGALKSFSWFEKTYEDDIGEPFHLLSWTLGLYRAGSLKRAEEKLCEFMLQNLYMIPHLLGRAQGPYEMWHGTNLAELEYVTEAPVEYFALWNDKARAWATVYFDSKEMMALRNRFIKINRALKYEPPGARRSELVAQLYQLKGKDHWSRYPALCSVPPNK